MPAWPETLPCHPIQGTWTETPTRNVASFTPEVGPPMHRRRSTATGTVAGATFKMTKAEMAAFLLFYHGDLVDGTLAFTWDHPITDESHQWVFEEPPELSSDTRATHSVRVSLRRLTRDAVPELDVESMEVE
jgi:hypothetical protein